MKYSIKTIVQRENTKILCGTQCILILRLKECKLHTFCAKTQKRKKNTRKNNNNNILVSSVSTNDRGTLENSYCTSFSLILSYIKHTIQNGSRIWKIIPHTSTTHETSRLIVYRKYGRKYHIVCRIPMNGQNKIIRYDIRIKKCKISTKYMARVLRSDWGTLDNSTTTHWYFTVSVGKLSTTSKIPQRLTKYLKIEVLGNCR